MVLLDILYDFPAVLPGSNETVTMASLARVATGVAAEPDPPLFPQADKAHIIETREINAVKVRAFIAIYSPYKYYLTLMLTVLPVEPVPVPVPVVVPVVVPGKLTLIFTELVLGCTMVPVASVTVSGVVIVGLITG